MTTKVVSDDKTGASGDTSGTDNATVTRDAHERLLAQRKKDQARAIAAEAERDALKAQAEEAQAAQLAEQKRYEELYTAEKKKREVTEARLNEMTRSQQDEVKRRALAEAVGGVKKAEFLRFADINAIQLNTDGSVDKDSITAVATNFRMQYPELLAVKSESKLPGTAAQDFKAEAPKPVERMSQKELDAEYRKVRGGANT